MPIQANLPFTVTAEDSIARDCGPTVLDLSRAISIMLAVVLLTACGEPMFENAGSQHSLLEDREACAMEMEQGPAAVASRLNPRRIRNM